MSEEIVLLTKEHIYMIHQEAIAEFGGDPSYRDDTDARIESILGQQYPVFGYDKYPTVLEKAAALMFFFTKGHCFIDGNKRVGANSAIVFLMLNGYVDMLDDDKGYYITMKIAEAKLTELQRDSFIVGIAAWLERYFAPIPRYKVPQLKRYRR